MVCNIKGGQQIMNSDKIVAGHSCHGQGRPLELGSGLICQSGAAVAQNGKLYI